MNDSRKIFKYEVFKILYDTKKIIYLLSILILFVTSCYLIKESLNLTNYNDADSYEINVRLRDSYKWQYEYAYGISSYIPEGVILSQDFFEMKEIYYEKYLYYDYLVNTKTDTEDYVNISDPLNSKIGNENGVFQIIMGKLSFFILGIISILISLKICFNEDDINYYKNIAQTKLDKRKVLNNKILFTILSILFINIIYLLVVYVLTINKSNYCLIIVKNSILKTNTFVYFITNNIISFTYAMFISLMTLYIRYKTHNTKKTIGISILIIALVFGIYTIFVQAINGSEISEELKQYFVFVNSQLNDINFKNNLFYYIIGVNLILTYTFFNLLKKEVSK